MASPPNEHSGEPAAAFVADHVLCISCGYDLRRLPITASCPECGNAVVRSLRGDRLAGAEPAWLRKVARGAGLLAWGWLLILGFPVAVVFLMFIMFFAFAKLSEPDWLFPLLFSLVAICGLGGLVSVAAGTILVTIQDPRDTLREPTYSARRLARIGMLGAVATYVTTLLLAGMMQITAAKEILTTLLGGLVLVFMTVGIVSLLRMLATLIERVPNPEQAKRSRGIAKVLAWALPAAILIQAASNFLDSGDAPLWQEGLAVFGGCFVVILWLVIFVEGVLLAILLFEARSMFKTCRTEASRTSA